MEEDRSSNVRKSLGECLIQAGLITEQDLRTALMEQAHTGERVGSILVRMKCATDKQITKALAYQLGLAYVSLEENPPDPAAMSLIPKEVAVARVCVGFRLDQALLTVATSDPVSFGSGGGVDLPVGYRIKHVVGTRSDILHCIERGYREKSAPRRPPRSAPDPDRCPHGRDRVGGCSSCARALQPGWIFCPFCSAPTAAFCSS
jgi:type IV pilus assembly protein PilB